MADPERWLALSYARKPSQAALEALWQLDATLADILRTTGDPMVGQLRLTWWYDAICALDQAPPPAQPVLQALASEVLPRGISGLSLAGMVDGWEVLLDPDEKPAAVVERHGEGRGAILFDTAAALLSERDKGNDLVARAGAGWALVDLARHHSAPELVRAALAGAGGKLEAVSGYAWPRPIRPLGALAVLAQRDARRGADRLEPVGAPSRVARMFWHRITGR